MASLVLPVIDYPTLHARKSDGTRTAESLQERRELWAALSGSGFAYLRSPGVSQETVEALFENSKKFFSKSFEEKLKIKGQLDKGRGPSQGYSNPAKLAVNPKTSDLKEFFGMYRDDDTESPNQWLPDADSQKMRADLVVFFESCHSVILELLSALTEEVGLPADTLHPYVSEKNHFIANLKYPEAQKNDFENRVRAAAHTDYGCLTLLFNDAGEGLQVKRLNHDWEYVKRKDGCAILNGEFVLIPVFLR
jgi:isopenicillin N synthase-like dioxygenase